MKKITYLFFIALLTFSNVFSVYAAVTNINGTDIIAPTAEKYVNGTENNSEISNIAPSEGNRILMGQNYINYADVYNKLKTQEEYQRSLNYNVGFARLAKLIEESTDVETKMINTKQIAQDQFIITISCNSWANGNWLVQVFPIGLGEYAQAPAGGYWFGLYDLNGFRIGTCQAYKIKM